MQSLQTFHIFALEPLGGKQPLCKKSPGQSANANSIFNALLWTGPQVLSPIVMAIPQD